MIKCSKECFRWFCIWLVCSLSGLGLISLCTRLGYLQVPIVLESRDFYEQMTEQQIKDYIDKQQKK